MEIGKPIDEGEIPVAVPKSGSTGKDLTSSATASEQRSMNVMPLQFFTIRFKILRYASTKRVLVFLAFCSI